MAYGFFGFEQVTAELGDETVSVISDFREYGPRESIVSYWLHRADDIPHSVEGARATVDSVIAEHLAACGRAGQAVLAAAGIELVG